MLIRALRAMVEVALLALLGQGVLAVLTGAGRQGNIVYRLFMIVTGPAIRIVRFLTPKLVIDKHLPFVTFFLLFWLWILLAYVKRQWCAIERLVC